MLLVQEELSAMLIDLSLLSKTFNTNDVCPINLPYSLENVVINLFYENECVIIGDRVFS